MFRATFNIQSVLTKAMIVLLFGSFFFLFPFGTSSILYLFYLTSFGLLITKFYKSELKHNFSRAKYEIFPWLPLLLSILLLIGIHGIGGYSIYLQVFLLLLLCSFVIDHSFLTKRQVVLSLAFVIAVLSSAIVLYISLFGLSVKVLGVNKNILLCGLTLIASTVLGSLLGKDEKYSLREILGLFVAIALFLVALILSEVRTAILGLFAILFVAIFSKSLKASLVLLASIIVVVAFFEFTGRLQQGWHNLLLWSSGNPNSSWGIRLELWRLAFDGFLNKPLFGWGTSPFQDLIDSGYTWIIPTFKPTQAHSDFFHLLVSNGLLGLTGWLLTLYLLIKRAKSNLGLIALVFASLAMGLSERIWFDNKATLPLFVCLWILYSLVSHQQEETKEKILMQ